LPRIVAGVDVGGERKGFHVVISHDGQYFAHFQERSPALVATKILSFQPQAIAIDSPCKFAHAGKARKSELDLIAYGIQCFTTPTIEQANQSQFYDWVFNGMRLYEAIGYPLFAPNSAQKNICFETFPNAIEKMLIGTEQRQQLANKKQLRTLSLQKLGYQTKQLNNIDFIDAALCSISADHFVIQQYLAFGDNQDGFIIIPNFNK
jgi:predicted nuclease with RNAse H fold